MLFNTQMTWVVPLGSAARLWLYSENHRRAVALLSILFRLYKPWTNTDLCPLCSEILGDFPFCRCGKEAQLCWLFCKQRKTKQKKSNSSKLDIEKSSQNEQQGVSDSATAGHRLWDLKCRYVCLIVSCEAHCSELETFQTESSSRSTTLGDLCIRCICNSAEDLAADS